MGPQTDDWQDVIGDPAKLSASLRVRDKVLAIVSHDLRSPLQTIVTSAALLELDAANDEQRTQIGSIQVSASHMKRMIGDLLEASTLELGQLRLELEPLSIADLLEEVALSLSARAEERSLTVEHHAKIDLPVLADRDRIPQVLLNLADNALRRRRLLLHVAHRQGVENGRRRRQVTGGGAARLPSILLSAAAPIAMNTITSP